MWNVLRKDLRGDIFATTVTRVGSYQVCACHITGTGAPTGLEALELNKNVGFFVRCWCKCVCVIGHPHTQHGTPATSSSETETRILSRGGRDAMFVKQLAEEHFGMKLGTAQLWTDAITALQTAKQLHENTAIRPKWLNMSKIGKFSTGRSPIWQFEMWKIAVGLWRPN